MRIIVLIITVGLIGNLQAQETKVWTLKECVDYALEKNISIKQSVLDKNSAAQDVTAAKWNFLPNLNASASQNHNFGSSISASGSRISANFRSNNFGVTSTLNLFNGFSNIHTLKQNQIGLEVKDAALLKMKNDVSLNVVNSYLQILFAKEQVIVAESQVNYTSIEVERIKALVDAGVLADGDLLNIESTLANDKQNLVVAQNTFTMTSLQLAQMLQLEENTILIEEMEVGLKNQEILNNNASLIFTKANETFPEIKLAELNILSAQQSIRLAQSSFYPSLSLSSGINTVYQHVQGMNDFIPFNKQLDNNLGKFISLSLNVPLFSRFQFRTNVNKSRISYQKTQYNLESERLNLRKTIETAYTDAIASSKAYDAATVSVEAQKKAFEYSKEKFSAGAVNTYDFNQAKNNLISAQSQLIRSKYDFMFKLRVLEFYYGIPFVAN